MPRIAKSYVYITCIRCGKERYKTLARYQEMLKKQTAEEIDATFVCGPCKHDEKSESSQS